MRSRLLVPGLSLCVFFGCAGAKTGTGKAGTSGAGSAGTTGAAGTTGSAGVNGSSGSTGAAGTTGVAGTTGAAGTTTIAGTAGTPGASGTTGTSGTTGAGGSITPIDAGTDAVCQTAQYKFEPKLPTAYILVDRSHSMFGCLTGTDTSPTCPTQADTAWTKLKDAMLMVVKALEKDVRFGFASYSGTNPANAGMCPVINKVAPKVMNLADITTLYNSLPFPPNTTSAGMKFESPAPMAVKTIGAELMADPSPGNKYLVFVTDGELDYCDDGNPHCATDDVIGQFQRLKAANIPTIVIGLQNTKIPNLPVGTLQAFANAGAGEATVIQPPPGGNATSIFDQCNPKPLWRESFLAGAPECAADLNACRGRTNGTYMPTAGPTKPYTPNAADQSMLINQLGTAIAAVKSCVFDLGDIGGKSIKVDLTKLDQAKVLVENQQVPMSDTNGWKMNGQSQLELVGTACANWRMPNADDIDFQFPCSTIIFE